MLDTGKARGTMPDESSASAARTDTGRCAYDYGDELLHP